MTSPPEERSKLDEREHQALDTLDSIPFEDLHEAGRGSGEELAALEGAITAARPLFIRLVAATAEDLLLAAEALATTDDRGSLDIEVIGRTRRTLNEHPEFAPAFARAVEIVGISLGLDREGLA
ncbi:MAG TPA: hypothetical protein VK034_18315, partial [Enhygromyxa sp.]|nr:hypothetical protein [Enhygromyxa sp.]